MKPTNVINLFLVATILIIAFSCKKDHDGPSTKPVRYITEKDTFNSDVTWYADTVYVIKKATSIKGKLTIRPGAIIKLESLSMLHASAIFAIGTKEQPIVFTSIYDDVQGGDTDGDGGLIKPKAGDWMSIGYIMPTIQMRFEYCHFLYGGALMCYTTLGQEIKNCTFAHNNGFPLIYKSAPVSASVKSVPVISKCALVSLAVDPSTVTISNNLFYDNIQPLCIYPGTSIDSTNTFSYNGTGNKQNGIFIYTKELELKTHLDWKEKEVPFVVQKDITIEDGGYLEFADGVVLKFLPDVMISKTVLFTSSLNGGKKNVIYTSYKDDAHGGDTNGDGNTLPHEGDWKGIWGGMLTGWWTDTNILYDNH